MVEQWVYTLWKTPFLWNSVTLSLPNIQRCCEIYQKNHSSFQNVFLISIVWSIFHQSYQVFCFGQTSKKCNIWRYLSYFMVLLCVKMFKCSKQSLKLSIMSHPIWSTQQHTDTILMARGKMSIALHSSPPAAVNNIVPSVPQQADTFYEKRFGPQGRTANKCWQATKSPTPPN